MKILLFCYDDYANYMYNTYLSLKAAGVECECVKINKHPFGYTNEAEIVTHNEALEKIKAANTIHYFHSNPAWWRIITGLSGGYKRLIVYHTGTLYRREPEAMNTLFRNADLTITDQCEFLCLLDNAAKWVYLATGIDTATICPTDTQSTNLPYKVAHFPSNAGNKGSAKVLQMVNSLPYHNNRMRFMFTDSKVTHPEQLKRMQDCDIYIEMFAPEQMGKAYGCYGVTAFEAAAQGKVVITQNNYPNVYKEAYGCEHPFVMGNTEQEFKANLHSLLMLPKEAIDLLKQQTRNWVVDKHSHKATGEYLKNILSGY